MTARPVRYLLIVSRREREVFARVNARFRDDPEVQVLIDRREGERRRHSLPHQPDRRRAERRRAPDYWEDIRHHAFVLVPMPRRVTVESKDWDDAVGRLEAWARDGQDVLGRIIPSFLRDHDAVLQRAMSAEEESARLRGEVETLRTELAGLRDELDHVRHEKAALVDLATRELGEINRLAGELGLRLKQRL